MNRVESFHLYFLIKKIYAKAILWRSIIPELQNRVTHYDVTTRDTNSKDSFLIFRVKTRCEENFNIVLELVTRKF